MPTQESYWLGRSHKCDVTAQYSASSIGKEISKHELEYVEWGKSMISNRHCRIFQQNNGNQIFIEDNSGNGTFINQQTHLRKGETRILHSGDEICLINMQTLRKKIQSERMIQMILQQFSFIIVQSKTRKSCVNPRAMNYNFGGNYFRNTKTEQQSPHASETSPIRRIENFYDMREVLGDGTSGQVRRAIHRQSGEERAVKIISLRRHVDTSIMEREVKLLQSLDHPYIVKLVEVFVRPGVAMFLVMELVKGGDLFDSIVEKQRYTEVEARRAMRRLLSAVHYLHHDSNIVHRDLKPENVLCSSPTDVKLADFGLAKIMKADGLKTFCGTPAYFAPEVLQRRHTLAGEGRYGKPADMWSLGVILYILLTGKPPFDPDVEESSKPFEVDFTLDDHIWSKMPTAKDIVQNMLCLDPQRRFTVRQACDHSWINVDDGDTHRHPLDDPAVDSTKHVSNQESNASSLADTSAGSEVTVQDERNDKILPVDDSELLESNKLGVNIPRPKSNIETSKLLLSESNEEMPSKINSEFENANDEERNQTKNDHSASASSSPRSPLTKLNFNERSNNFRNRIMREANPCLSSPGRLKSPDGNEECQVAVTPTSSNKKEKRKPFDEEKKEDDDEKDEDPILSQFSSEVSSVESFSDSSTNDVSKVDQSNKRTHGEKTNPQEKSPKRAKICGPKQTTLKSWLVKKG